MKKILTFLLIVILTFSYSEGNSQDLKKINTKDSLISGKNIITGIWTIKQFYFAQISAMDEKTASEWLNKDLIINSKTHFNFDKIKAYKNVFKDENECEIINIKSPEITKPSNYFDTIRDPLSDLKINGVIKIFKTKCKDNPFSEFVLTENNRIIIHWDGVFFVLVKK